jgi:hypothetical protein
VHYCSIGVAPPSLRLLKDTLSSSELSFFQTPLRDSICPKRRRTEKQLLSGPIYLKILQADSTKGNVEGGIDRFINRLNGAGSWERLLSEWQKDVLQNVWTALVDERFPLTQTKNCENSNFLF